MTTSSRKGHFYLRPKKKKRGETERKSILKPGDYVKNQDSDHQDNQKDKVLQPCLTPVKNVKVLFFEYEIRDF